MTGIYKNNNAFCVVTLIVNKCLQISQNATNGLLQILAAEQKELIREVKRKAADNPRVTNIIQPRPSQAQKRQHATIKNFLSPQQKLAVEFFEKIAELKGNYFI